MSLLLFLIAVPRFGRWRPATGLDLFVVTVSLSSAWSPNVLGLRLDPAQFNRR